MARRRRRIAGPNGPRPNPNLNNQPGNDGRGNKGRRKKGRGSPVLREARRDVMLTIKPVRREIRRIRKQGIRDYRQAAAKTGNIYDALGRELAPLMGQFAGQSQQIASGLNQNLGTLADTIGSNVAGVPQSEISAGAGMFGALGGGALAELANNAQRNAAYQTSVQQQSGVEGAIAQRNMLQDLLGFKQDLGQQRLDLMRDVPQLIRQRMDFLRDQEFDQGLALQQLQLERLGMNRSYGLQNQQLAMQQKSDAAYQWLMQQLAQQNARGG